jgi:hypothetical protein
LAGAWALADALRTHPALNSLELGVEPSTRILGEQANHLGDEGAAALASLIAASESLRSLDLSGNGITDAGAALMAEALEDNPRVTTLTIGKGLSPEYRQRLQSLLKRNQTAVGVEVGNDPDVEAIRSVYRIA